MSTDSVLCRAWPLRLALGGRQAPCSLHLLSSVSLLPMSCAASCTIWPPLPRLLLLLLLRQADDSAPADFPVPRFLGLACRPTDALLATGARLPPGDGCVVSTITRRSSQAASGCCCCCSGPGSSPGLLWGRRGGAAPAAAAAGTVTAVRWRSLSGHAKLAFSRITSALCSAHSDLRCSVRRACLSSYACGLVCTCVSAREHFGRVDSNRLKVEPCPASIALHPTPRLQKQSACLLGFGMEKGFPTLSPAGFRAAPSM